MVAFQVGSCAVVGNLSNLSFSKISSNLGARTSLNDTTNSKTRNFCSRWRGSFLLNQGEIMSALKYNVEVLVFGS